MQSGEGGSTAELRPWRPYLRVERWTHAVDGCRRFAGGRARLAEVEPLVASCVYHAIRVGARRLFRHFTVQASTRDRLDERVEMDGRSGGGERAIAVPWL